MILGLLVAIATVLVAAGCGGSGEGGDGTHPNYTTALKGAPAPLAKLYSEANQLLPGGTEAFEKRVAALNGYPVVANVWASWCGPCRLEFPTLQKLSAQYGKQVAFLGVNSEDSESNAAEFLAEDPVPYPSYSDPHQELAEKLGAHVGLPDTAFFDREGKLVYLKQGPYARDSELEEDVEKYALNGA